MLMPILVAARLAFPAADTVHLVLVATVDVHGQATDWDYLHGAPAPGGLSRAASVLDSIRTANPGRVILVDGGDALTGSLFGSYYTYVAPAASHPVLDAMNALQYDAATLGEHDFDTGVGALNRRLGDGRFPVVSTNLRVVGRDDTLALHSYVVLQRSGIRIGIAGFTTPGATVWNRDQLQGHLRLTRLAEATTPVFPEMRKDADLVVLLAHAGLDEPSSYDTAGVGAENGMSAVAGQVARPDVVVLGHTGRTIVDTVINGVHFVQPGHDAERLAIVDVYLEKKGEGWVPVRIRARSLSLAKAAVPPAVQRRFAEQDRALRAWSNEVIGTTSGAMRATASRVEDTPVAQWMTDLLRVRAGADVAAITIYDPRAGLDLGEVPRSQVLALYPTDNTLRAVRVSGPVLRAFLERSARHFYVDSAGRVAANLYQPGSAYDIVGGVDYVIDLSRPAGDRIRDLRFHGRLLDETDTLTFALSNSRLSGAGGYDMLHDAPVVYDQGERIVDLLLADLEKRRLIRPEDFGRPHWRIEPASMAAAARAIYVRPGGPVTVAKAAAPAPLFAPDPRKARDDSARRATLLADSAANRVLTSFTLPVTRGSGGGVLGSLAADAYRTALRTDIAFAGTAELTGDFPAGPLTVANFNAGWTDRSQLQKLTLSGADLQALLEQLISGPELKGGVSGLQVSYDPTRAEGDRIRSILLPSSRKLAREGKYTVALTPGMLARLSMPTGGKVPPILESTPTSTVDALLGYFKVLRAPITPPDGVRLVVAP